MTSNSYHIPVLLHAAVNGLNINPLGTYVDVTFGGGGHSRAILDKLDGGKLFAFDQDTDASANVLQHPSLIFIRQNFRYLRNYLRLHGADFIDGLLADLGVSSHQFDDAQRGFSIRYDARLDMRMNPDVPNDAYNVVNTYEEKKLADVFYFYGELRNARQLAAHLCNVRSDRKIETTGQLKEVFKNFTPRGKEAGFYAQLFQALRIEVNAELDVLKEMLMQTIQVIKPGGRLVVISYHSLEDRLVKNFIRTGNFEGEQQKDFFGNIKRPFVEINKKPIVPDEEEINMNPRARSAKLRIAERTDEQV